MYTETTNIKRYLIFHMAEISLLTVIAIRQIKILVKFAFPFYFYFCNMVVMRPYLFEVVLTNTTKLFSILAEVNKGLQRMF